MICAAETSEVWCCVAEPICLLGAIPISCCSSVLTACCPPREAPAPFLPGRAMIPSVLTRRTNTGRQLAVSANTLNPFQLSLLSTCFHWSCLLESAQCLKNMALVCPYSSCPSGLEQLPPPLHCTEVSSFKIPVRALRIHKVSDPMFN